MSRLYQIVIILAIILGIRVVHCQPYPADLIAYYPMHGNANDSFTRHFNGTMHGCTPAKDRFGRDSMALSFNGKGDYLDMGTGAWYMMWTGGKTFCFWQKITPTDFVNISKGVRHGICNYSITKGMTVTACNYDSMIVPLDTGWQHTAVVFAKDQVLVYVNGKLAKTQVLRYSSADATAPLLIGRINMDYISPEYYSKGTISDLLIYHAALRPDQIARIYDPNITNVIPRLHIENKVSKSMIMTNLLGKKMNHISSTQLMCLQQKKVLRLK